MPRTTRPRFPDFVANFDSPEAARAALIDKPLAAARPNMIATGLGLLSFMSAIPDALIAAERRELARLSQPRGPNDKQVARLTAEIEQLEQMRELAAVGRTRVERVIEMATNRKAVFQGFVSDGALAPLPGLTVRIAGREGTARASGVSAKTADDGFFRIALDDSAAMTDIRRDASQPIAVSAGGTDAQGEIEARVEILDASGAVIHRDPTPLILGRRGAYREYVLPDVDARTLKEDQQRRR